MLFRPIRILTLALALTIVAACDSAEERAEGHYQSSLELIEAGDVDRAIVELKNVFNLNGRHKEARLTYAELMRERGDFGEAFSHYLLLTEQYPEDPEPRLWLFRIALLGNDFEEAKKHGDRAKRIAPDNPEVQAATAIIEYREAAVGDDPSRRREAARKVMEISASIGDEIRAIPIQIDNHIRDGELNEALELIEVMIADDKYSPHWQEMKLQLLMQVGSQDDALEQLAEMVDLFPNDENYAGTYVQWLIDRSDADKAEEFLRNRIDRGSPEERTERQVLLISFMSRQHGTNAAIEELDRLVSTETDNATFRAMRAGMLFDTNRRDEAIAEMIDIVDNTPGGDKLFDIKTSLALMHLVMGDEVTARARIDEVLEGDPSHVGALKRQAAWLIQEDQPDQAVLKLRIALGGAPEDPEIMSLMSEAHLRNGSRNLAGEMLSLAVQTSDHNPQRVLDYARFLIEDNNFAAAEELLITGLRQNPDDADLLATLGRLYVETSDWGRAQQAEEAIRRIGTPGAITFADGLKIDRLRAQNRGNEALRFLEELAAQESNGTAAEIAIARTHMQNGNFDDAEAFIETKLNEDPNQPVMQMLQAALFAQTNRTGEAERILRRLVKDDPSREMVWRTLYEFKVMEGKEEEAKQILDEAFAAIPDSPDLMWTRAGQLEREGDFEGSISIYERLYEQLPDSLIVANNLASLLSTNRESAEDLERAYSIARRLRGSNVPAYQDTFGWIAYKRGEVQEAIDHLEPAAVGLSEDPLVHYHLGMAYSADEQWDPALDSLELAVEMLGPDSSRLELAKAMEEIEKIIKILKQPVVQQ